MSLGTSISEDVTRQRVSGSGHILDQLSGTYLRARWYLGAGMILMTIVVILAGVAEIDTWVVAAAGAVVLAHAFAMRLWNMDDIRVALLVDLTAASMAAMIISTANQNHTAIVLTFVGGSTLIALFTARWVRFAVLLYVTGLTMSTLLIIEGWNVVDALGDFIGGVFVAGLTVGVIAAIRSRLVELEAARAQTIGVVSHELRNHLTGVIGAIDLITDDGTQVEAEEADELLQLAHQQSIEAGEVIEDLLIASRAERGVLDAMPEPVDLCPITETVIRRTSLETGEILYDFSGGPIWAMADSLRYKQIIRNLLTNALRYGGDTIRVSIEELDDTVSVVVADNGEGVDKEEEPQLFLPYHGGRSARSVAGSTGLGLWIARNLAHKMGGDIRYRRQSGQTVFELTLPAAHDPSATPDDGGRSRQEQLSSASH